MLDLSNVTLVSIDSASDHYSKSNIRLAAISRIIPEILKEIKFGDVLMINPFGKNYNLLDLSFEGLWDSKSPVKNIAWLNNYMIKALPTLIKTEWYLIVQWDGFVINPEMWTNEFLNYPFIGGGDTMLNGGFSLRNTETMLKLSKINECYDTGAEDGFYSSFLDIPNLNNKKNTPFKIAYPDATIINKFCFWDSSIPESSFGWHRHEYLSKGNIYRMFNRYGIFSQEDLKKLVSYSLYKEIEYPLLDESSIKLFDIEYNNEFFDNY